MMYLYDVLVWEIDTFESRLEIGTATGLELLYPSCRCLIDMSR
jgi:hypothetical protein